ncbi:MAG: GNAT family N-acetyltransferase [Thermoanaerobaculia bacterium]|nr:GNAT family N-acetyltransferase [Thermoanaerobaculia bacterium]
MEILRLLPHHAEAYRALLLASYADHPEAFTSTLSERQPLPISWWESRLSVQPDAEERVWGALDGARLVGVAGLRLELRERTRHKAWLFGMAVLPEFGGRGIGRSLVEAVIAEVAARPGMRVLQLTVTESNGAARRLYESCGFQAFGSEPKAIRIGDRFLSKIHMWREIASEKELS